MSNNDIIKNDEEFIEEIISTDNNKNAVENGVIYVVATPIGNIEDITIRALKILRNVDFILAEDTRVAIRLLNFYKIKKTLFSYHSHSSEYRINEYINEILNFYTQIIFFLIDF